MSKSILFSPIKLGKLALANRVVVAPMCQYSAEDGVANDWHLMHLGNFAVSGAGLVIVEATGVTAQGRITPGCLGLWNDEQEAAFKRVVDFAKGYGASKIAIQLAHAGRKASTAAPWDGALPLSGSLAWQTVAPSPLAFDQGWHEPAELTLEGMAEIKQAFVEAAIRADRAGFDAIEIHGAHGYLLSTFLSPLINRRKDDYGGSLEKRMRFPLEVFEAIRKALPHKPLGYRINGTDWVEGGWDPQSAEAFAEALEKRGGDFIHISSGGTMPDAEIKSGPGYQVDFAARVKQWTNMPVIAVGAITNGQQAETILRSDQADLIALGRTMLYNPRWVWHAAAEMGEQASYPPQYARCHPSLQGMPVPGKAPKPK